jgi:hypothetical protein
MTFGGGVLDADKKFLPEETDKPFAGLVREWYMSRSIVVYKLVAVSEQVVDSWMNLVVDTVKAWDTSKPYLAIHDLSQAGVSLQYAALVNFDMMNIGITMGGRFVVEDLFDAHPNWMARVAVNFNLSLSGQTNRTLMTFLNKEHPAIRYKTFYSRTKCFKWLSGEMTDTSEVPSIKPNDD